MASAMSRTRLLVSNGILPSIYGSLKRHVHDIGCCKPIAVVSVQIESLLLSYPRVTFWELLVVLAEAVDDT